LARARSLLDVDDHVGCWASLRIENLPAERAGGNRREQCVVEACRRCIGGDAARISADRRRRGYRHGSRRRCAVILTRTKTNDEQHRHGPHDPPERTSSTLLRIRFGHARGTPQIDASKWQVLPSVSLAGVFLSLGGSRATLCWMRVVAIALVLVPALARAEV